MSVPQGDVYVLVRMCGLSFAINVVVLSLKSRDTFYDAKVAKHVDKTVLNGQKTGLFAPFLTQFVIFRPGAGGFPAGFFHRPPDGGPYRQNGGEGAKKTAPFALFLSRFAVSLQKICCASRSGSGRSRKFSHSLCAR
jgi:hypothetical protein